MRGYLDLRLPRRQDEDRRRPAGRGSAADRSRARGRRRRAANLAVDANGRFDLATALAYAEALAPYDLLLVRGGGRSARLRAAGRARASTTPGPMATGENLFSMQDARNLIRYGGMRPGSRLAAVRLRALATGWSNTCARSTMLEEQRLVAAAGCIPHGGHQMSLNIAAGLGLGGNESYPGVFQPFGGFADDIAVDDGYVGLPDIPGIGFEAKANLWAVMKDLAG